jgi:putative FmdB family regulatory protein
MPVFEFICTDCGKPFEELVLNTNNMGEVTCPACHSQNIFKKISIFASKITDDGAFSSASASSSSCSPGSA